MKSCSIVTTSAATRLTVSSTLLEHCMYEPTQPSRHEGSLNVATDAAGPSTGVIGHHGVFLRLVRGSGDNESSSDDRRSNRFAANAGVCEANRPCHRRGRRIGRRSYRSRRSRPGRAHWTRHAQDTIRALQAQGYNVIVNKLGTAPLNQSSVIAVRPGQSFTRTDSGVPGAGNDIMTTVTGRTVYVDVA